MSQKRRHVRRPKLSTFATAASPFMHDSERTLGRSPVPMVIVWLSDEEAGSLRVART